MDSNTRKQTLHSHFYKTREKFLRLLTLVRWTQRHKRSFDRFNDIIIEMDVKGSGMLSTTDKLYDVDKRLRIARYSFIIIITNFREDSFDLPTAIDVLTTGDYNRLPHTIYVRQQVNQF
jgi:hypothetical protein